MICITNERYQPRGKPRTLSSAASSGVLNPKGNKDNGIADGIGFNTLSTFTLEDVVAKYGEPTTVWLAVLGTPEAPEYSMIVLFEDKKIRVDLEDQELSTETYLLEPSVKITNIVYYSEENSGLTAYLQPWHGYGEYIEDDIWR